MKIAAVLIASSIEELKKQAEVAIESGINVLEFRLDQLTNFSVSKLQSILNEVDKTVILTVRSQWFDEEPLTLAGITRFQLLLQLAELHPDYLDLEYPYDMSLLKKIPSDVGIVVSFMDFDGIAKINYSAIRDVITVRSDAIIKIVATPSSPTDLEKMWFWAQDLREDSIHHVVIGRGKLGKITRTRAIQFRDTWTYGLINKCMFEEYFDGMMTIDELHRAFAPGSVHIGHLGSHSQHNFTIDQLQKLLEKELFPGVLIDTGLSSETDVYDLLKWMAKGLIDAFIIDYQWQKYVVGYLDELDYSVKQTGICTLIVLKDKKLIGYNTYYLTLRSFVLNLTLNEIQNVYLEGVNNIIETAIAFFNLFAENIVIRNRTKSKVNALQDIYPRLLHASETQLHEYQIVVNVVPFGTSNLPKMYPVPKRVISQAKLVVDTIITNNPSPLMNACTDVPFAISGEDFFFKNFFYIVKIIREKQYIEELY